ncbi:hypothetical protein [Polynucleobacter sp. AP-Sving-400A-A2]|uniref:hypothetical protein n=1 Tax=Polynucleobacter sp. AP-Sving-400A-A2 TaxID=2081049 RepID=UPI001BFCDD2A|nr:hypothetical protein [Polynucleobacter sp. AP-Sving-400A-A2]QWE14872.1 hypothetical protein C2758_01655 [Polynucleobacter sp. AP-Sving-400A-A2]
MIQNQERFIKVRLQNRDKRLVEYLNLNRSQRVAQYLERAYFKTLEELRRQIEWRKKQGVIDVHIKLAPKSIKH